MIKTANGLMGQALQAFQGLGGDGAGGRALRYGLLGAGAGGIAGGLSSLRKPKDERQTGGSMLTGALAGGAMGAGLGMAGPQLGEWGRSLQLDHSHDQQFPKIDQLPNAQDLVEQELANRSDHAVRNSAMAMGGLGGGLYGASRNALQRGANSMASEGKSFYRNNATAESIRQGLVEGGDGFLPKNQMKAVWEALTHRGGDVNNALRSATPSVFPDGRALAAMKPDVVAAMTGNKGLLNHQVRDMYGRGMMRSWKSPGAGIGAAAGAALPWLGSKALGAFNNYADEAAAQRFLGQ